MIVSRVRAVLRRLKRAGYTELLVESGLERGDLDAAIEYWRRRGNLRIAGSGEIPESKTPSCGLGCAGCSPRRCLEREGLVQPVRVFEWRDADGAHDQAVSAGSPGRHPIG